MSWQKIWLVLRREYLFNFKRPSFLFTAFGVPAITLVVMFVLIQVIAGRETNLDDWDQIYYIDRAGVVDPTVSGDYQPLTQPGVDVPAEPDAAYYAALEAYAQKQLEADKFDAFFVVTDNYIMTGQVDLYATRNIPAALQDEITDFLHTQIAAQHANLDLVVDPARLEDLGDITMRDIDTGEEIDEAALIGRLLMPFIFVFLYFMASNTTAQFLMGGVVEEKENRLMEILATSIKPIELLWGKMLGLGALSLTQVVLWGGAGLAIASFNDDASTFITGAHFRIGDILLILGLFVINFLLFSSIMMGIGAAVTAEAESRQFAGIFTFVTVLPLVLSSLFFSQPDSALPVFFSLFPLTAATGLVMRMGLTTVPLWQIVTSLAIQVVSVVAVMWLSAKVFRLGMLMYGKPLTPRTLIQALREGRTTLTTASDEVRAPKQKRKKGLFRL